MLVVALLPPLLQLLAQQAAAAAAPRPHLLVVVVDDWGYANVGFHRPEGSTGEWQTPKIDALVAQGVELRQFYVHSFCTPTRSSLQTGRLPVRVQMSLDGPCSHGNGIPANMTGLAAQLKLAGYTSALVGKWDAGMRTPQHTPRGRGYDRALSYFAHGNWMWSQAEWLGSYNPGTAPHGAMPAPDHPPACTRSTLPGWNANPRGCAIDLWEDNGPAHRLNGTGNEELIFRGYMRQVVQAHDASTPLFLTYTPKLVHYPLQAPPEYQKRFATIADFNPHRQMYAAMSAFLDDCVSNVTGFFKAKGMWENTLMVTFSDNVRLMSQCVRVAPDT
jgi:arylsulfatase B